MLQRRGGGLPVSFSNVTPAYRQVPEEEEDEEPLQDDLDESGDGALPPKLVEEDEDDYDEEEYPVYKALLWKIGVGSVGFYWAADYFWDILCVEILWPMWIGGTVSVASFITGNFFYRYKRKEDHFYRVVVAPFFYGISCGCFYNFIGVGSAWAQNQLSPQNGALYFNAWDPIFRRAPGYE